jgi:hypothetical protein
MAENSRNWDFSSQAVAQGLRQLKARAEQATTVVCFPERPMKTSLDPKAGSNLKDALFGTENN